MSVGIDETTPDKVWDVHNCGVLKIVSNSRHVGQSSKERDAGTEHKTLPEHRLTDKADSIAIVHTPHDVFL